MASYLSFVRALITRSDTETEMMQFEVVRRANVKNGLRYSRKLLRERADFIEVADTNRLSMIAACALALVSGSSTVRGRMRAAR